MSAFDTPTAAAGQQWNAQDYAIDAGFVPLLGGAVARLLDPRAGERILDLGCGDGVLSTELALSGARIHGVDASPELVIAARARGVDAQVMDGHALSFDSEFDAVFSNAALHWMGNPDRVLEGVRRATGLVAIVVIVGRIQARAHPIGVAGVAVDLAIA
ncbi:hypothetical protein C7E15_17500, partial [Stenotrophomonas maltophilia]